MMKFLKGETVVEPSIGICTVVGMTVKRVDGEDMTMYIFEAHNANIYVPADQIERRGIRRPMTRDDVKRVLNALKVPVAPNRNDARLQYVNYREIMKSGDPNKIAKLLRDLHILSQSDDLKGKEKEIMEQAKRFLCEEISFVREASKNAVMETINEALRQMYKKKQAKDKEKAKKAGVDVSMGILGYEDEEEIEDTVETTESTEEKPKKKKVADYEDDDLVDEDEADEDEDAEEEDDDFAEDDEDDDK